MAQSTGTDVPGYVSEGPAFSAFALAGGAVYLVRRNQRKAELDEGIWHEAPAPASTA